MGVLLLLDRKQDLPLWSYGLVILVFLAVLAYGTTVMSAQFFMPAKCKGDSSGNIALTFDDGPVPGKTEKILEILASHKVPAAFFVLATVLPIIQRSQNVYLMPVT